MRPDVGAVIADKDCDIADDAHAALGTVAAEGLPLLEEGKLQEALHVDLKTHLGAKLVERLRLATNQIVGPRAPGSVAEAFAQDGEDCVIIEPPLVLGTESVKAGAGTGWRGTQKSLRGFA